jgi:hypothetical protein
MLVLPCRRCSHSYEVGPDEPVEGIKCPACGAPLQGPRPAPLGRPLRLRLMVAGVLALFLLAGLWLAYRRTAGRTDPVQSEARFRQRVREAGGDVQEFSYTPGSVPTYSVLVGQEGYTLSAFVWVNDSGLAFDSIRMVQLGKPPLGDIEATVWCGGGTPEVVKAFRTFPGENRGELSEQEKATCKRLAEALYVALKESIR